MELLLGPEDSEVDLGHILMYARKKKGRKIFGTKGLKEQVLSPIEPSVKRERIVRQARSEKHKRKLFPIFSRRGAQEIPVASMARWEEHLRMLTVLQRECLHLAEQLSI